LADITSSISVTAAQPLATPAPWELLGISKSSWNRLRAADKTPPPISLIGGRPLWRVADLESWLAKQPAFRGRSKRGGRRERVEDAD
jgi:hypothetical protein